MQIVLNEHEWAEEMIRSRSLGKKPYETMRRIARYYIDSGMKRKEVRTLMDRFLLQCDPSASLAKWSDLLDSAFAYAAKYPAIHIDEIVITEPEMERIDSLNGSQVRRLAFTLLCLSKYWNLVTGRSDSWVNSKDSDIMHMANIGTSIKRQSQMFHYLYQNGLVDFSKRVDNTNVKVLFASDGNVVLRVTDFRNLGYQYMMYHGGPYFVCANCGTTTKRDNAVAKGSRGTVCNPEGRGRKQIYCKECALQVMMQQKVNHAMRNAGRVKKETQDM